MPGPAPLPAEARQRRNVKSTALVLVPDPDADVPALPPPPRTNVDEALHKPERWHPAAVDLWEAAWRSGARYSATDAHALLNVIILTHLFHEAPDADEKRKLSVEIRQARRPLGLDPLSRANLHWTTMDTEEKAEKRERQQARRAKQSPEDELSALD